MRFNALTVAKHLASADIVDFVTMYPNFDQGLLKERVAEAIREAWEWEDSQETLNLLLEIANQEKYCVCQRPYNNKEYYIQCCNCQEWFHPKCLGRTQAQCETERVQGRWQCGRAYCATKELQETQVEAGETRDQGEESDGQGTRSTEQGMVGTGYAEQGEGGQEDQETI